MFIQCVKHYHQWLHSAIPLKTKLGQISSDNIRIQGPSKRPSLSQLHPVSAGKKRYRKGRKCKISLVLQSPVSSTQASPKVEASNRPKQAQHFSTHREVEDGNSRVHQDLPDSRGMGSVDRPIGRLPSHPHPSSLKEIPKILPQVSGVPVHLPTFWTSHSPQGLSHDCKGGEAHGPLQRAQTPPIPGRLADQVSIPGGSPSEHSGSGRSNPVLGMDHQSTKIRTESHSGVFVCGLRVPPRFSPCKAHSREMAQTTTQVKTCFDCKMFDVSNWVASLNRENGPRGTSSHEALSVSPQGALEISSTTGQPPSLDRSHLCTPRLVAEPCKRDERLKPSSQRPQYPTLYRRLKRRLGRSLRTKFYPRSVVSPGKRPSHKRPRIESCLTGPETLQRPVPGPNSASCDGQLNCGCLHQQTRGNTLSGDVCISVENHDLVPSFHITLKARHIPGCLNVMADLISRSNQVQSTEWSLHPQVFKQISQKWFTPHVDLFATHLNHKLPLYMSPIPDPKALDTDALNIDWTGLIAYAYPPTALLHRGIQKIRQCSCLIILIAPGWPGMPWFWDLVQLSTEIPLQLPVSTTLFKQSHNYVFHRNPQHLNLHACLKNSAEKIRWISPLHL